MLTNNKALEESRFASLPSPVGKKPGSKKCCNQSQDGKRTPDATIR